MFHSIFDQELLLVYFLKLWIVTKINVYIAFFVCNKRKCFQKKIIFPIELCLFFLFTDKR